MRGDKTDRLICLFDVFVCVYEGGGLALSRKQSIKGINGVGGELKWCGNQCMAALMFHLTPYPLKDLIMAGLRTARNVLFFL